MDRASRAGRPSHKLGGGRRESDIQEAVGLGPGPLQGPGQPLSPGCRAGASYYESRKVTHKKVARQTNTRESGVMGGGDIHSNNLNS